MEERKLKEIEHSDRRRQIVTGYEYHTDTNDDSANEKFVEDSEEYNKHFSNMKFYSITRTSFAYRDALLYSYMPDKQTLDYCCGNGEIALEMASRGAKSVVGIDISPVAVNNANNIANEKGFGDRCKFKVMDAEKTEFSENSFDVIHEYGALHHLELNAAFKELARILKPGGKVVCTEALRHNPVIHWYRGKTPQLRTDWEVEHILGVPEIMQGKKFFKEINVRFFHLAALAAVPFRKTSLFRPLLAFFEAVDSILLRIPFLRRMAWIAVIEYKYPRKMKN